PIGEEKSFKGVVDLVAQKAWTFADGKPAETAVPADMASAVQSAREALIEMVAEADDALMEKFFEEGTLSQDELVAGLKRAVVTERVFPLVCTSAAATIGIQPLFDTIIAYVQSPAERPFEATAAKGDDDVRVEASDSTPVAAFVWKTVADPFAGR